MKYFSNSNSKLFFIFFFLVFLFFIFYKNKYSVNYEKFTNTPDPFDDIYAQLYNRVFDDETIPKYDIDSILAILGKKGSFLEAGSGVGKHYKHLLSSLSTPPIGVDKSRSFIKVAKINNPLGKFVQGELTDRNIFKTKQFNNILCLQDSFYHNTSAEMNTIISNFNYWLSDNGDNNVAIHLMDNEKLDPSPRMFSILSNDNKGRQIATTKFKKFDHVAKWIKPNNVSELDSSSFLYTEKFIMNNSGKVYKHEQELNIPGKDVIIKMFLSNGFKVDNIIDLISLQMNTCNIYVFKKITPIV